MSDEPAKGSHPKCWRDGERHHVCQEPTGRPCIEKGCDKPAGTQWGPLWCPDHDVERIDRITTSMVRMSNEFAAQTFSGGTFRATNDAAVRAMEGEDDAH